VLVFVYGTLKRGFYNGKLLEGEATAALVGSFVTQDKFPLITDEYYVPYLLPTKGTGFNIIGEVWKVNQTTFDKLDKLEGFPDYYNRKQIQVSPTAVQDGAAGAAVEGGGGEVQEMKPWVYTMPAGRVTADLLAKTMMPEYSLEEHLAKYVPKEKRGTEHISHNTSNASIVEQTEQ